MYVRPEEVLLDILFAVILVAGFGFILLAFKNVMSKWDVRLALDDGMTVRYIKARMKGKTEKDGQKYYALEYRDPENKRVVELLIPDKPGYMRFMRFWGGLRKYVVFRADKSGVPIPWYTKAPGIDVEKLEYMKTHEMIINALRSRILLSRYMLYVIILVGIILLFTGIITWKALERPIIVQIANMTTHSTPMTYPPVSPPPS